MLAVMRHSILIIIIVDLMLAVMRSIIIIIYRIQNIYLTSLLIFLFSIINRKVTHVGGHEFVFFIIDIIYTNKFHYIIDIEKFL